MTSNNQPKPKTKDIKIIVVGSCGTGKTSFCQKWIKNEFPELYKATITTDFSYKMYEFQNNFYKVQLWDLAGQDKNIHTTKILTKNAHGVIIFSDITHEASLKETLKWKKAIDSNSCFIDGEWLPCILIQNKIDLLEESQLPPENQLKDFAKDNHFDQAFRTSVKEEIEINEAMSYLIQNIVQRSNDYSKKTGINLYDEERKSLVYISPREKDSSSKLDEKSSCC